MCGRGLTHTDYFLALPSPYPGVPPPYFLLSVLLVRNLNSDDQGVVLKALRLAPEGRLQKDGLRALSSLLVHGNNKVMAAVSTQLRSLALGAAFRERVRPGQDEQGQGRGPRFQNLSRCSHPSPGPALLP